MGLLVDSSCIPAIVQHSYDLLVVNCTEIRKIAQPIYEHGDWVIKILCSECGTVVSSQNFGFSGHSASTMQYLDHECRT